MATSKNLTDQDIKGIILKLNYDAHSSEEYDILLGVTVTLTMTQMTLLTKTSNTGLTI